MDEVVPPAAPPAGDRRRQRSGDRGRVLPLAAAEIRLSGRDVGAAEADRIGRVSRAVPGEDLLETSYEIADRIIGWGRPGLEITKRML